MLTFGTLDPGTANDLVALQSAVAGLAVQRRSNPRSETPFPGSEDLERAIHPHLVECGFAHHIELKHPKSGIGFEYDFWRDRDGVAIEIMGYRADDEVYKDILKFHVHAETRVGVVWVPRWKWVGGKRQATNYAAAKKALTFADSYMDVDALVLLAYDWAPSPEAGRWAVAFPGEG
jgi:hypothetical protein